MSKTPSAALITRRTAFLNDIASLGLAPRDGLEDLDEQLVTVPPRSPDMTHPNPLSYERNEPIFAGGSEAEQQTWAFLRSTSNLTPSATYEAAPVLVGAVVQIKPRLPHALIAVGHGTGPLAQPWAANFLWRRLRRELKRARPIERGLAVRQHVTSMRARVWTRNPAQLAGMAGLTLRNVSDRRLLGTSIEIHGHLLAVVRNDDLARVLTDARWFRDLLYSTAEEH